MPLRWLSRIFSVSSQASPPQPGEELFAVVSMPGMLLAPDSHKFKPPIPRAGELCWAIPDFPLVILSFSREKCTTCGFSSAWGKNAHLGLFLSVTDKRQRKTWERNPKNHNAKKLQGKEKRGKRNQLSGCLETAWVLLEDLFFPLFWVVFTSPVQTSKSRNSLGWELPNPSCGGWN